MVHKVWAITAVIAIAATTGLTSAALAGPKSAALWLLIVAALTGLLAIAAGSRWLFIARQMDAARAVRRAALENSLSLSSDRLEAMTTAVNGWLWERVEPPPWTHAYAVVLVGPRARCVRLTRNAPEPTRLN